MFESWLSLTIFIIQKVFVRQEGERFGYIISIWIRIWPKYVEWRPIHLWFSLSSSLLKCPFIRSKNIIWSEKKTLWRSLNECDKKWLFFSSVLVLIPSEFTLVNFQIASMWIRTRVMIQKKMLDDWRKMLLESEN